MASIDLLVEYILNSSYTVAFTGAGISTGSGLPDYRGKNGIFNGKHKNKTTIRSSKPWYQYEPNQGHYALVRLIQSNYIDYIISQNVDGLHIKSGIPEKKIAEIHGNLTKMICTYCTSKYNIDEINWDRSRYGLGKIDEQPCLDQPICLNCGGRLVSSVVDFGDSLPNSILERARSESIRADLFLVLGSSLSVFPAGYLPKLAKEYGATIVIINLTNTKKDHLAEINIKGDLSVLLPLIYQKLRI